MQCQHPIVFSFSTRKTARGGSPTPPSEDISIDCVPQLDGNISILSDDQVLNDSLSENMWIDTVVNISFYPKPKKCDWPPWAETQYRRTSDMPPVRQTVNRDNKLPVCHSLPIVSVSNCRSLIPKVNNCFG